jgi:tetratricopeptide (TPR) repeat protein
MTSYEHLWHTGDSVAADAEPTFGQHSGHARLRGPFTAAGSLARRLLPDILADDPDLARRYDIEILAAAPELASVLPNTRPTLTSEADPLTRTRYYPHNRAAWVGNGLTDLVLARASALGGGQMVRFDAVDHLDPTDAWWLAGLVRRADPAVLRVTCTSGSGSASGDLDAELRRHAHQVSLARPVKVSLPDRRRAEQFVAAHCISDDLDDQRAYAELRPAQRAALHDAQAELLASAPDGEAVWGRGALAYHLEHGGDPVDRGAAGLAGAQRQCLMAGFYDAVVDLGFRIRSLLNWQEHPEAYWLATVKMTVALQAMGRPDEAMELFDDACANSTMPSVHMQAAYGRAMVYTRYYDQARRDLRKAKGLINTAVALAGLSSDDQRRAYNRTFNENGLALVDMHLGELDTAVELIEAGIARLDREVEGGRYLLHRSVLRYNHAQLMVRVGRLDDAIAEYTRILAEDPHHPDYWFDRAGLYEQLGRLEDALADYTRAALAGPPYPEPYYNRAELLLRLGDPDGAVAGYSRVLELDPTFLDAYINRAWLRLDAGDLDGARSDVDAGLELDSAQPHLLCIRGLVEQETGSIDAARNAFEAALEADPTLASAWASLGALLYEAGDANGACQCLRRSLELEDDPDVRNNLALAMAG